MCKRTFLWLTIAAALILSACSPVRLQTATEGPKVPGTIGQPSPAGGLQARPPFLDALRAELARKNHVPVDQVVVEEYQAAQWPDSCLGLPRVEEVCAQTITPGYLVVVSLPSGMIELHTDSSGESYRQTTLALPPGERPVALTWQRSGGFAGICRRLIVYLDGGYRLEECVKEQILGEGELPEADLKHLRELQDRYADFRWQSVPPAGSADMFTEELSFNGNGSSAMSREEQEQLSEYIAQIVSKLLTPAVEPT